MKIHIKDCNFVAHGEQIMEIFNEAILHTSAIYEYQVRDLTKIYNWFQIKIDNNFPIIGAFDENDNLLGFSSYGAFRTLPAYKYTVEHSVYVNKKIRAQGIGRLLLNQLISMAKEQQLHCLVGVIDCDNHDSIKFHQQMGFSYAGEIKEVGYKFAAWRDICFYQKILDTPQYPDEN